MATIPVPPVGGDQAEQGPFVRISSRTVAMGVRGRGAVYALGIAVCVVIVHSVGARMGSVAIVYAPLLMVTQGYGETTACRRGRPRKTCRAHLPRLLRAFARPRNREEARAFLESLDVMGQAMVQSNQPSRRQIEGPTFRSHDEPARDRLD